jgi:multiple sugar transport system substrate-binding protein
MPIPNLFGSNRKAVWGDSHTFVLPHQRHPDPVRREATHEAVSLILRNSALWAEAGHTPAYEPIVRTQAFRDLVPNRNYAETARYLQYDPKSWFTGSGSPSQNWLANSIQNALLGREDVGAAINTFAKQINAALRKGSPL